MQPETAAAARHPPLFPLVRRLSRGLTPVLIRAGATPNLVTMTGMASGLAAVALLAFGHYAAGAALFVLTNVLDSCDGEIARATGTQTRWGQRLDDFSDWLVHTTLFLALGFALFEMRESALWLWLGAAAALGNTIEYVVEQLVFRTREEADHPAHRVGPESLEDGATAVDRLVFALRGVMQKDFCFLLGVFLLLGLDWLLVLGAAIGNHVYWLTGLYERGRQFHA